MTKIACWNVRGLNSPLRQKEVKAFIKERKLDIIGLVEVKVRENNRKTIENSILRNWEVIHSSLPNSVSRIWVAWNPGSFQGQVTACSEQHITCKMSFKNSHNKEFYLTVVYGYNERSNRKNLWRELRYQNHTIGDTPWLLMGDFNIIINSRGKIGRHRVDRNAIKDFTDCIHDLDLAVIPSTGFKYTWSNRREGENRTYTKIDHMLCNEQWKNLIPHFQLAYEAPLSSDHSPGILSIQLNHRHGPKPFKFMKGWMRHPTFHSILRSVWQEDQTGNPLLVLTK